MNLHRSVLTADARGLAWPPPAVEAWPDAVLLDPAGASGVDVERATTLLVESGVEVILRVTEGGSPEAPPGVAAVAASVEAVSAIDAGHPLDLIVDSAQSALRVREVLGATSHARLVIVDPDALRRSLGVPETTEVDALAFPRGAALLAGGIYARDVLGRFEPAGHHRVPAAGRTPSQFSFAIGYRGALCRSWDEVREANAGYVPDPEQRERAQRILDAMRDAVARGLGAISLDGRMIDLPFIKVAQRLVDLGRAADARSAWVRAHVGRVS